MNNRIAYFDFLRGIAILMVVAIHTFSLNSATDSSIAVRQIFNIAVPLFLAISGFFLSNKDLSSRNDYLFFLKKQIPRVYIPCFIWSLPLFFLALYLGGSIMVNTIYLLFCGFSIYYFIALIIQYYILLPVFQKMTQNITGGVISSCISIICICAITFVMQVEGLKFPLIVYAGLFPLWLIFFFMGVYIGKRSDRNYSIILPSICVLLLWVISFFESKFLMSFHGGGVGIKLSSFIYAFCGIIVLFSKYSENLFKRIQWFFKFVCQIGKYSFGIYLSHCYFILFLSRIFSDWTSLDWLLKWLIITSLSFLFVCMGNMLLPKLSKYLGFK